MHSDASVWRRVVTVRVATLKGADAGAYYVEQLPNCYLDSGEPRGIWLGDGAQQLGTSGEVGDEAFLAVMAGMDPRGGGVPAAHQSGVGPAVAHAFGDREPGQVPGW